MAEDHRFQSSDGRHRLCINNCGFLGSPATQNMCSKCYTDLRHKNAGGDSSISFSHAITAASVTSSSTSSRPIFAAPVASISFSSPEKVESSVTAAHGGRCSACRKKVGLLGFRCRCGTTFCGTHRYPEKHGCTFDFKAIGRMEIAKANPVVKADKLDRI